MIQKSRGPTRSPCKKDRTKQLKVFLRWHGPHQVLRVEAALPLSQKGSPDFVTHHKHLREFCQGLVFIRKKGYDSICYGEPLWLRGNNRFRPDEPDVGNANVGNIRDDMKNNRYIYPNVSANIPCLTCTCAVQVFYFTCAHISFTKWIIHMVLLYPLSFRKRNSLLQIPILDF